MLAQPPSQESVLASEWRQLLERLGSLDDRQFKIAVVDGCVTVGEPGQLSPAELMTFKKLVRAVMPWRKGPFRICGEFLDAEWRSDLKWSRVLQADLDLQGKRIVDIGSGNGYYMFRMLEHAPSSVLGVDPSERFRFTFELLQKFAKDPRLSFSQLGLTELAQSGEQFDVAFLMGIVYHQRDPLGALRQLRDCLRPGGVAVVESQIIPGDGPLALFPPERYAKARNVYFLPTVSCLQAWLTRAGFSEIQLVSTELTTPSEQRRTSLMEFESLTDFLDPTDPSKTVEGFPAPRRALLTAKRPL